MLFLLHCLSKSSQTTCRNSSLLAVTATLMTFFVFMQFPFSSYVNLTWISSSKSYSIIVTTMIQNQNLYRNEKASWILYSIIESSLKYCSDHRMLFLKWVLWMLVKNRCYKQLATELLSSLYIYAIHKCDRNSLLFCFLAFHHVPLYVTDTTAILDAWLVAALLFSVSGMI